MDSLADRRTGEGRLSDVLEAVGQVDGCVGAGCNRALIDALQGARQVDGRGSLTEEGVVAQLRDALADVDRLVTVARKGTLIHELDRAGDVELLCLPGGNETLVLQLTLPAEVAEGLIADVLQVGRQLAEGTDVEHLVEGAVTGLFDRVRQVLHSQDGLILEQELICQLGDGVGAAVALVRDGSGDGERLRLCIIANGGDGNGRVGRRHVADAVHGELAAEVGGVGGAIDEDLMAVAGVAQELGRLGRCGMHNAGLILILVVPEIEGILADGLYAGADIAILNALAVDKGVEADGLDGVRNDDLLEFRGAEGPLVDLLQAVRQVQLLEAGAIEGRIADGLDRGRNVDAFQTGAVPQQAARDLLHVLRQLNIGDVRAAVENIRAVSLDRGGKADGRQALAAHEGLFTDIGDRVGDIAVDHTGHVEGRVSDEFQRGRKRQRSAGHAVEGHAADGLDAVGNVQGLDAAGKEEGRTADGL